MTRLSTQFAKRIFLGSLRSLRGGTLKVASGGETWVFGDGAGPYATLAVHDDRFFRRAVFGGDVGLGESWMDGEWSSPDLTACIRLAVRNLARLDRANGPLSALARLADRLRHRLRANTVRGSRRNIGAHYDLSNRFFRLFLDRSMMYSCALYRDEADSLERAQAQKLDTICRKLRLGSNDHVLEIGTGWGGFAEYAVRNFGCRVTTTTISRRQHEYAKARFAALPERERITLLREDYRNLRGQFDHIVSIEMFEAVGFDYYDTFFQACDRLLRPGGTMLLQTITIVEQAFDSYRRRSDWIQKYIFPGAELASVSEVLRSLARVTSMSLFHAEEIGTHYARTLAEWRSRFLSALPEVRALGFDERFERMWLYYLSYCEGAFLERHIGDMQLLLAKNHNPQPLFGEPWRGEALETARSLTT